MRQTLDNGIGVYICCVRKSNPSEFQILSSESPIFLSFLSRWAGDYNLHHVCASVCECVMQFSLKLLQLHIFGKLFVLMKFYPLQYFWGVL